MVSGKLHRFVDTARVRAAMAAAERLTSVPIHVSIAPYFWGSARRTAERAFEKHGLAGVLFFVVPSRREFVVIGDAETHERLGQRTWDSVVEIVREQFGRGDPTRGLELGIEAVARELARQV